MARKELFKNESIYFERVTTKATKLQPPTLIKREDGYFIERIVTGEVAKELTLKYDFEPAEKINDEAFYRFGERVNAGTAEDKDKKKEVEEKEVEE